jgi:hypothetical protein
VTCLAVVAVAVAIIVQGATRVDEGFRKHLASVLGCEAFTEWAEDPTNAAELQELMYEEWEVCKCVFDGRSGVFAETYVSLPYSLVFSAGDEGLERLDATGQTDRYCAVSFTIIIGVVALCACMSSFAAASCSSLAGFAQLRPVVAAAS